MKVSLPAPRKATSLPRPPVIDVVAVAAEQHVVAGAADDGVVAGAAVEGQVDHAGASNDASMVSLPPRALTTSVSLAPSEPVIVDCRRQAVDETVALPLPTIWIVSAPLVPLTMTVSAAPSPVPLPGVAPGRC